MKTSVDPVKGELRDEQPDGSFDGTEDISEVMNRLGLPQEVENMRDANRLLAKFGTDTSCGYKSQIRAAVEAVQPGEQLYFVVPATTIKIRRLEDNKKISKGNGTGAAFMSDRRVVCVEDDCFKVHEFAINEIHSIAPKDGTYLKGVTFCTQTMRVNIKSDAEVEPFDNILRDIFMQVIAHPNRDGSKAGEGIGTAGPTVCECAGCGAAVVCVPGNTNTCEFCGRPAASPKPAASTPARAAACRYCGTATASPFCPGCSAELRKHVH